jgi:hypothetical protein
MQNLKQMVEMTIEKRELEGKYGWVSCFDAPEAYDKMEIINNELFELAKDVVEGREIVAGHLLDSLDSIASDVMNGNYEMSDLEISYHTQDDFIDNYVLEGMDDSATQMFNSLFYFMNSDERILWLGTNHLMPMPNTYTNKWIDYVLMIHE